MSRPEHVRCENCVYWLYSGEPGDDAGICQRYPPLGLSALGWRLNVSRGGPNPEIDQLPSTVLPDDWCGEFRAEWPDVGE